MVDDGGNLPATANPATTSTGNQLPTDSGNSPAMGMGNSPTNPDRSSQSTASPQGYGSFWLPQQLLNQLSFILQARNPVLKGYSQTEKKKTSRG